MEHVSAREPATFRLNPRNYWARWLRRWPWSAGSVGLLFFAMGLSGPNGSAFYVAGNVVAALCAGLGLGTLVNFVVAAFPTRRV